MIKFKTFILSIVSVIFLFTAHNAFAQKKDQLEKQKKQIEKDIEYTNQLLQENKKSEKTSISQIVILKSKIQKRENLISNIYEDIELLDKKIDTLNAQINELSAEIGVMKSKYAVLIKAAYKNRNEINKLLFIFSSSSFNQAYMRLKYYTEFSKSLKFHVKKIIARKESLGFKIKELQLVQKEKNELLKSIESEKTKLKNEKEEVDNQINILRGKQKELLKAIKQKEQKARELQKTIEKIIAEEIRKAVEAEKNKKLAEQKKKNKNKKNEKSNKKNAKNNKNKVTSTPTMSQNFAEVELSDVFSNNKGKFPWPTTNNEGIIAGTFGEHAHPILPGIKVKNNGIDISTNKGCKAKAIHDGEVTAVLSIPGSNQVVIIRHGDYLSVYANINDVSVKVKDKVKAKQEIGSIYTNNSENKTELHFELWYGKTILDPLDWIFKK